MQTSIEPASPALSAQFLPLDLNAFFNNDGISFDDGKCDGDFDGKGATFPAEELPSSNSMITVDAVPFLFPSKAAGDLNNMVLNGQTIPFDSVAVKAIHVLGATDGQNGEVFEEEVTVSYVDGSFQPVYMGLSNWLLQPRYQESVAFLCSHIHFPDPGQQTIIAKKRSVERTFPLSQGGAFHSVDVDPTMESANAARGIWRPRLFRQRVVLDRSKSMLGLTFMDNFNFHVFALTLETGGQS